MTKKRERIAYNLTQLARSNGACRGGDIQQFCYLADIASEEKLVAVDSEFNGEHYYVFMPREAYEEAIGGYEDGWRKRVRGAAWTWAWKSDVYYRRQEVV